MQTFIIPKDDVTYIFRQKASSNVNRFHNNEENNETSDFIKYQKYMYCVGI